MKVPFVNLGKQYYFLRKKILNKIDSLSLNGDYILGNELDLFEKDFANYCNTKFAIGVGNGSDAISFSLLASNIGKGDEVIIPCNSFIATAWTVANVGATPVFVDVLDDYNIDPKMIIKKISSKTKAIIPVHLTGKMADMKNILKIAKNFNLLVIEDAAQAVGASLDDKKSGSYGITGCFSLHPLKNLHVHGDGGIITTNDKKIYNLIKKMRNHGFKNRNICEFWGYNSRLDNIQAAIARIKLPYLDKWNNKSIKIAKHYNKEFKNLFYTPVEVRNNKAVYHRYIIQCKKRDQLKKYLLEKGIETKINYPIPLHLQPASKKLGYKKGDMTRAEKQSKMIISLPLHPYLEDKQVNYVVEKVKNFYR